MLTDEIRGKSLTDLAKVGNQDVLDELGIEISPARLKCALLSVDTLRRPRRNGHDSDANGGPHMTSRSSRICPRPA